MFVKIQSFLMAIYMLIVGEFFGNHADKLDVTYNIESGIYEYTAGDTFEVKITMKNNGHPFIYYSPEDENEHIFIYIYQEGNGINDICQEGNAINESITRPKEFGEEEGDAFYVPGSSFKEILVKRGFTDERVFKIKVGDGAPLGKYNIKVFCYCETILFEDVITVK